MGYLSKYSRDRTLRSLCLVELVLVAMLMATLIPFSTMVYAQNQEREKTEAFLALAERSKEQVASLIEFVKAQEGDVSEEAIIYDAGPASLKRTWTAFSDENYEKAVELAKEALKNFREAIKVLNKALEPIEEETEAESEQSALGEAIARAGDRRDRVMGIIDAMLESHHELDATLSDIKTTLEVDAGERPVAAKTCLDEGDAPGAAKELGEVPQRLISSALISLRKQVSGALNSRRIESLPMVIKKLHARLSNLSERTIKDSLNTTLEIELTTAKSCIVAAVLQTATVSERMFNPMITRNLLESIQRDIVESRRK